MTIANSSNWWATVTDRKLGATLSRHESALFEINNEVFVHFVKPLRLRVYYARILLQAQLDKFY